MENTSYIASIVYQIETWLYNGLSKERIFKKIELLKGENKFPPNLILVDCYFDAEKGSSAAAFLDTNTGETIVGFAGTNLDNGREESFKDIKTDGWNLGVTGIKPDSSYFDETHAFMKRLKEQGYDVTQMTGHSLGGALAMMMGLSYDTALVVTYNGAPVYGLGMANSGGAYDRLYAQYHGKILRFVSESDWLNRLMGVIDGKYYGEEIKLYNEKGHDLKHFFAQHPQSMITSFIALETQRRLQAMMIDFDGDGQADLVLDTEQLQAKHLLDARNLSSFGGRIKLNPESFAFLARGLRDDLVHRDMAWIQRALQLCQDKNDTVERQRVTREVDLQEQVLMGLKDAHLMQVLGNIEATHGELSRHHNLNILSTLSAFDARAIMRNFDDWGSSANRKWFINKKSFDAHELNRWIKNLQSSAAALYDTIMDVNFYDAYAYTPLHLSGYRYEPDTFSKISQAFVNVTNSLLGKVDWVFAGVGKRLGKQDGIVDAIAEVLAVEATNVSELETKMNHLADVAQGIAANFETMDAWLQTQMHSQRIAGDPFLQPIPPDYVTYLKVHEVFDDVKDVLEAYDIQVEAATQRLSQLVIADYSELIARSKMSLNRCERSLQNFKEAVMELVEWFDLPITSTYNEYRLNPELGEVPEAIQMEDSHGTLASFFSDEVVSTAESALVSLVPILHNFNTSLVQLNMYDSNLMNLRQYFNTVIETAVYDAQGLSEIVKSHQLISRLVSRMIVEVNQVVRTLADEYQGQSLERYQEQLGTVSQLLTYYQQMIDDCFGDKYQYEVSDPNLISPQGRSYRRVPVG